SQDKTFSSPTAVGETPGSSYQLHEDNNTSAAAGKGATHDEPLAAHCGKTTATALTSTATQSDETYSSELATINSKPGSLYQRHEGNASAASSEQTSYYVDITISIAVALAAVATASRASLTDTHGPAQIYWNGVSVATTASMRFPLPVSRANLYVGKSAWSTDPMFTGQMKDLLVWDVALSPAQLDAVRLGGGLPSTPAPLISMMRTCPGYSYKSPSQVLLNAGDGTFPTSIALPGMCTETCAFSSDGVCDDGESGAESSSCTPGTDCADCGPLYFDTRSIAAADVDGDGDLDVLLGNYASPSRVLLNAGNGSFPTSIALPGGSALTYSIAAADVDGDGDLDVLLGNSGSPSRVLLNAGNGVSWTNITLPDGGCTETCSSSSDGVCDDGGSGAEGYGYCNHGTDCADCGPRSTTTYSIAAADVDGDGDLDVLLGNSGSPSRVLLNAGDGVSWTSIELPGGSGYTNSIAAADVDGDGDLDVLLGNYDTPSVLLNAGNGTFPTSIALPARGGTGSSSFFYTNSIAAADVDGDGDLDVLLGNSRSPSIVLLNAGNGTFPTSIALPASAQSIAAADIDGDGDLDVLLGGSRNSVLLNAGDGVSWTSITLPGGSGYTNSIAAADVDGDGDLDLLLGSFGTPSRVLPFIRCSDPGTARSRYGNGCVRCPSPSSRRDDVSDVCYECDEHSQLDASGACVDCTAGSERVLGAP
ncbi:calcium binding hemolysin, partial [Chrysochromulina tobinii]